MPDPGYVPLSKKKPPQELQKVPETRPPQLDSPILSDREAQEAYEQATQRELARIEFEKARKGEVPITYFFRKWIGPAIVGLASLAWILKGC